MFEGWKWITDATCIQIKPRTNQKDYVHVFFREDGYWSDLGRIGGRQEMNLGNDLSAGTAAHEMMHTLGVSHEHQRSDRKDWIFIDWDALAAIDTPQSESSLCNFSEGKAKGVNVSFCSLLQITGLSST